MFKRRINAVFSFDYAVFSYFCANKSGPELIAEYERVLSKLGEGPLTEAQENVRKEVYRNLSELYALNGDEEKAKAYSEFC